MGAMTCVEAVTSLHSKIGLQWLRMRFALRDAGVAVGADTAGIYLGFLEQLRTDL